MASKLWIEGHWIKPEAIEAPPEDGTGPEGIPEAIQGTLRMHSATLPGGWAYLIDPASLAALIQASQAYARSQQAPPATGQAPASSPTPAAHAPQHGPQSPGAIPGLPQDMQGMMQMAASMQHMLPNLLMMKMFENLGLIPSQSQQPTRPPLDFAALKATIVGAGKELLPGTLKLIQTVRGIPVPAAAAPISVKGGD